MKPLMVFHAPYPMEANPTSASRLRPKRLLEAFEALGYEVHQITGYPKERARAFKSLKKRVSNGADVAFLYSENSTQPNLLATSIRKQFAPFLDARILSFCQKKNIPAGQFYRDIYWKFAKPTNLKSRLHIAALKVLYRFDLRVLDKAKVHIFLPSDEMKRLIPIEENRVSELPPGLTIGDTGLAEGVQLFYVGGLGEHYQIHELLKAVRTRPEVKLVLCVPAHNWSQVAAEYESLLASNIQVVHESSQHLTRFYSEASIGVLTVAPSEYRDFAAPLKFYEYLGQAKPILATKNTKAGRTATELGVGLAVDYSAEAIGKLIDEILADLSILERLHLKAVETRKEHTWVSRAKMVEKTLMHIPDQVD